MCKAWSSLFFCSPGLWRALPLDGRRTARAGQLQAWLAAKRALLARLGPLVASVDAQLGDPGESEFGLDGNYNDYDSEEQSDDDGGEAGGKAGSGEAGGGSVWEPTNALQTLPPGLSELRLSLECGTQFAAALALPLLPRLTSLHLDLPDGRAAKALQPAVAAWLAQLPHLEAFSWHGSSAELSLQLAAAVGSLSSLTALELRVRLWRACGGWHVMLADDAGQQGCGAWRTCAAAHKWLTNSYSPCALPRQVSSKHSAGQLSPEAFASIGSLTALRALACNATLMAPEAVAAAAGLPHLTALSLSGLPGGAPLAQLTALAQLHRLSLAAAASVDALLELPAPAAFPALVSFEAGRRGNRARWQASPQSNAG